MEANAVIVWIDHRNKLISCAKLASGILYRFASLEALCAYCQPLLEERYRLQ